MAVPGHVQLVVLLVSVLLLAAGARDMFFPGAGLPIPDDDKVIGAVFGKQPVGACGKKEVGCVPGRMLFISQVWGSMVVTITLIKLVTTFSNPEGTYLRRNLFLTLGLCDLVTAYFIYVHEPLFVSQGGSAMGFMAAFGVEGLVLLHDATMRERNPKKVK